MSHLLKEKIKKMARKMKLDPNDSDALREYSRMNPETGRALYRMPIGRYVKKGDRYIKTEKED